MDGRDGGEPRRAVALAVLPEGSGREPPRHQHRAARVQLRQRRCDQPVHVEERHHAVRHVVRAEVVRGGHRGCGGGEVSLPDRHALGPRGGAAGVQHQRDGIGIALGQRGRCAQPAQLEPLDAQLGARRQRRLGRILLPQHRARREVVQVGPELALGVGRVERRRGGPGAHHGEERRHDLRAVRERERDGVAGADPVCRELSCQGIDLRAELPVGDRLSRRGLDQRDGVVGVSCEHIHPRDSRHRLRQ